MVRIFALFLTLCFGLAAQTVNINVPAVNSKGNQVSVGQVFISWHSFLDNNGKLVQGSQKTVPVVNGTISTSLVPSDNAGYVYNVLLMSVEAKLRTPPGAYPPGPLSRSSRNWFRLHPYHRPGMILQVQQLPPLLRFRMPMQRRRDCFLKTTGLLSTASSRHSVSHLLTRQIT